ncbi:peroxin 14/17 [Blastomyces dermatitidis ER-3]|uniref:Peroxisomal membrane protein PEX14 n=2 Tax=Ajellomyces dermatitidis TaxID=5039 RepID=F2T4F9_AJEDA|nr:peroxin 14/17 [Blastomyces dermatitidis ER-3]EEQ87591.1 peroxin 14/17 [Blastomyces dermatitidis ER-3]EGE77818.1 peroxin 14/17 [Blastomyces dermatitidis ATCC 18188]EQL38107.1 hypothetical protein BDFG_00491 [Blastomyces dermatitidis ATCC 26199]
MGGDSKSKALAIPSWQLPHADSTTSNPATAVNASSEDKEKTESSARETLIEQASRFLEDESIRDAPTDKKVSFLESKGLNNEDIQKLLGVSRNPEATSTGTTSPSTDSVKTLLPSSQGPQSPQIDSSSPISPPSPSNNLNPPTTASTPPIITYPEFLLHTQKPPPLVTLQGVLYTLYGAGGLAATLYGASQFLINPMLAELSRARHELAETAQRNLCTLNEKLEKTVSSIPPMPQSSSQQDQQLIDDDTVSNASDPTELFHRDIATQTSPELLPSATTPVIDPETDGLSPSEKTVNAHVKRLQSISSRLTDYLSEEDTSGIIHGSTEKSVGELKNYLDGLIYSNPSAYLGSNLYGIYNDNSGSMRSDGTFGGTSKEEDAIAAFKAEIRSVKGTLLSARNFPAGGGVRFAVPGTGAR